jgi:hypothetical protein
MPTRIEKQTPNKKQKAAKALLPGGFSNLTF